jgi:hypothetical protein
MPATTPTCSSTSCCWPCARAGAKTARCFALDTHAGRGLYRWMRTRPGAPARPRPASPAAVRGPARDPARRYRGGQGLPRMHGNHPPTRARPGCWRMRCAAGPDRLLRAAAGGGRRAAGLLARDPRVGVHQRDGYAAISALLPPRSRERLGRGLVLVDPPYEAQLGEFDCRAFRGCARRWRAGRRASSRCGTRSSCGAPSMPFYRSAASLQAKCNVAGRAAGPRGRLTATDERQRPAVAQPALEAGSAARACAGGARHRTGRRWWQRPPHWLRQPTGREHGPAAGAGFASLAICKRMLASGR